jgi:hypothetical protein
MTSEKYFNNNATLSFDRLFNLDKATSMVANVGVKDLSGSGVPLQRFSYVLVIQDLEMKRGG